MSPMFQ